MKIIDLITKNRNQLKHFIDLSLGDSLNRTYVNCTNIKKTPEEPDYIADLTLNWSQDLHNILKSILSFSHLTMNFTSVYCHQKPLADFGGIRSPEIGDILFVFKYTDIQGETNYNSLLLQAKRSKSQISSVSKNELHQLTLYTDWPKFKYKRAGILNGSEIDIHPKCISLGAKYLLIDPNASILTRIPGWFGFGCAVPNKSLVLSTEFSDEIIDFLAFNGGRSISSQSSITEDWSKMIWDLLEITKSKMSKRKNMDLKSFPRQVSHYEDGTYFMEIENKSSFFTDIGSGGNGKNEDDDSFLTNGEDGGVSTVFIEIYEND